MERPDSHIGNLGWGLLVAGVIGWDVYAPETLSHAGRRALEHPAFRYLYIGAVGATALHLLDVFDEIGIPDPFKLTLERARDEIS